MIIIIILIKKKKEEEKKKEKEEEKERRNGRDISNRRTNERTNTISTSCFLAFTISV